MNTFSMISMARQNKKMHVKMRENYFHECSLYNIIIVRHKQPIHATWIKANIYQRNMFQLIDYITRDEHQHGWESGNAPQIPQF